MFFLYIMDITHYLEVFITWWTFISILYKFLSTIYKYSIPKHTPKRLWNISKALLQVVLLPYNLLWFGLSYYSDIIFKDKYWIKISSDYEYWDGTSFVRSLYSYEFVELAKCFNKFSNEFECYKNAKSQLWVKLRIAHKNIWWHDYYLILLSKKQISKFNRKAWDSPLYYITTNKSD